jgi:hypothetical protein
MTVIGRGRGKVELPVGSGWAIGPGRAAIDGLAGPRMASPGGERSFAGEWLVEKHAAKTVSVLAKAPYRGGRRHWTDHCCRADCKDVDDGSQVGPLV